LAELRD